MRSTPAPPCSHRRPRRALPIAIAVSVAAAALPAVARADTPRTTEVPTSISSAAMTDIAAGVDGVPWITAPGKGSLFAVTPDGRASERPITGLGRPAAPQQLAVDDTGSVWSTEPAARSILRSEASGATVAFSTGSSSSAAPADIAAGGDGNVWFTTAGDATLGRITASGTITVFPAAHRPVHVARDPRAGSAVWFTTADGLLGHADADGTLTYRPAVGGMTALTAGPADDGGAGIVWATTAGSVLRFPADGGAPRAFTAGITPGSAINGIAAGRDGNLWYADGATRTVGRVSPQGAISAYATTNPLGPAGRGAPPRAIAPAPSGGALYLGTSEEALVGDVVGIVSPVVAPTGVTGEAEAITTTAAVLTATVNPEGGSTTVTFEYGGGQTLGQATESVSIPPGIDPVTVRVPIAGLDLKRTYSYRVRATNTAGSVLGASRQLTTLNVPLPTNPLAPNLIAVTRPATTPQGPVTPAGPIGSLTVGAAAARVNRKGIVSVKLQCGVGAACKGTVAVTARLSVPSRKKGGKPSTKAVTLASKPVSVAAGTSAKVGLRLSSAGRRALRRAGRKGLATLAVVTVDGTTRRSRLTLKG